MLLHDPEPFTISWLDLSHKGLPCCEDILGKTPWMVLSRKQSRRQIWIQLLLIPETLMFTGNATNLKLQFIIWSLKLCSSDNAMEKSIVLLCKLQKSPAAFETSHSDSVWNLYFGILKNGCASISQPEDFILKGSETEMNAFRLNTLAAYPESPAEQQRLPCGAELEELTSRKWMWQSNVPHRSFLNSPLSEIHLLDSSTISNGTIVFNWPRIIYSYFKK